MASSRTTRPAAALASLVPVLLLVAACGSGGEPDQPTTAAASTAAATPTPSVTPTPTVTVPSGRPTAAPAQVVPAGAVADGAPAQVTGVGSAAVTYTRGGEFAVVIVLDCTACAAGALPTVLTGPGRMTPYGEGSGPLAGSYLMDVFEGSAPEQSVWLQAEGPWSIRFESWNDLPGMSGPQSGTGSTVRVPVGPGRARRGDLDPGGAGRRLQRSLLRHRRPAGVRQRRGVHRGGGPADARASSPSARPAPGP